MAVGWIHIMFVGKLVNVFLVRRFWKSQTSSTGKYCSGAKGDGAEDGQVSRDEENVPQLKLLI